MNATTPATFLTGSLNDVEDLKRIGKLKGEISQVQNDINRACFTTILSPIRELCNIMQWGPHVVAAMFCLNKLYIWN